MPEGLVVGAEGLIGRALLAELRAVRWVTIGTTRRGEVRDDLVGLDLADSPEQYLRDARLGRFLDAGPASAFLLAAATGYEHCEKNPLATRVINVDHTVALARQLVERGAFVVFPSSSAVFADAGTEAPEEDAALGPSTEYGRQKAAAEQAIADLAKSAPEGMGAAILRIAKVVHAGGRFGQWMRNLVRGEHVEAARDLLLAPVSLSYVVRAMKLVGERRAGGVYHVSCERDVSYFELARMLAAALGCDGSLVRPIDVRVSLGSRVPDIGRLLVGERSRRAGLEPQTLDAAVEDLVSEFERVR